MKPHSFATWVGTLYQVPTPRRALSAAKEAQKKQSLRREHLELNFVKTQDQEGVVQESTWEQEGKWHVTRGSHGKRHRSPRPMEPEQLPSGVRHGNTVTVGLACPLT